MAWNGAGAFARLYNWVSRAANPATKYIDATSMDAEFDNFKTGLEACLTRNGETSPSANLPMGSYRHTGVGAATALTDYARASEVQRGVIFRAASPGGTIDAMTATMTPAPTLTAGMIVTIIAPGTGSNTVTAPTLNLNGGGAVTIRKSQTALAVGDYDTGDTLVLVYDGTYFELMNPKNAPVVAPPAHSTFTTDSTGGDVADFIPFIDNSDGNADNKVLVPDFLTNALASITAKSAPIAADTIMVGDSAASNAVKRSTFTQVFTNLLSVFTAKTAPVPADSLMIADSAASGAPKISTLQQLLNSVTSLTSDTSPDHGADFFLSYDNSATAAKKVPGYAIGPALPGVTNLLITNGGATTNVTITFDQAVLVNTAGQGISVLNGSYTCDCSANAAINRLDTGSLANNTEYHIWLIARPDGTLPGSLMSQSATAPTLPTGYSGGFRVRIGCFITGGAATFLRIRQVGNRSQYVVAAGTTTTVLPLFTVSTNASKTALTAAGSTGSGNAQKVPSTASTIILLGANDGNTNASMAVFPNNDAGYSITEGQLWGGLTGTGTGGPYCFCTEMILESTSIYYISGNNGGGANAALATGGWRDRVNAS
jgi:hypothetical protein